MDQAEVLREMRKTGREMYEGNLLIKQKMRNQHTRVVAITSGKGGVGKTNVAVNIAYILSTMGKRILLLDADAGLANIDVILGITPEYNLCHVLQGERTLSETIVQGPGGVKILPAASGIQQMAELSRGQRVTLLEELDNLEEEMDFMFIDTGAGIAGNVMYFATSAREIIVVVSPEPTSLTDAYALIKVLCQNYVTRRFMILVNMAKGYNEAKAVHGRLSNATNHFLNLSVEYLGYIPFDQNVPKAVKQQRALAEIFPSTKASRHLFAIAEKLCHEQTENCETGMIKFFSRSIVSRDD